MKILSYNVNGIRAATKKGLYDWFEIAQPDIICLQELKAQPDQIDSDSLKDIGYEYSIFNSAQKKGYSGVAIVSKTKPDYVELGMKIKKFDNEGRVIRADFGVLTIICVYIPSGTTGGVRQEYKMEFLADFTNYIAELRKKRTEILVCGDFNICHKPIDINNPEKHTTMSGFLPEEREWFDQFVATGMVDTYRFFDKSPNKYTWWSFRARSKAKNLGWRIDYEMISEAAVKRLKSASIFREIEFSDHCPIRVELDMNI